MDIKNLGVFTKRIDLADAFEKDDEIRKDYEGVYVVLREPTTEETFKSQGNSDYAMRLIPDLIIDHNIDDGEVRATNKAVGEIIKKSATLYTYIAQVWGESLPLARRSESRSSELPEQSSTENE
jgi:hypothetical protein